ncbi:MAG: DUF1257 domain-containing protein [Phycisphaerae bacterium]|nr:DUF1257 domain-containing protein [Phycisphaerae bacterium]
MVCGCEVIVFVVIPVATSLWPAVVAAATAAAGVMGFATAKAVQEHVAAAGAVVRTEVELSVENAQAVTEDLRLGQEVVFHKGDVEVVFCRNINGKPGVRVRGMGHSRGELEAMGQEFCRLVTQQYAYHRVMTKLRQQRFNIVSEEQGEDGTVRLKVSIYRD